MVMTGKETERQRRGKFRLRTDMTDYQSTSSFLSSQAQGSLSSSFECSLSLKVTPKEKAGTIPGTVIAASVALNEAS